MQYDILITVIFKKTILTFLDIGFILLLQNIIS